MAKAAKRSITVTSAELTPLRAECTDGDLVKVTLATEMGDPTELTMSATALINLVNLSVGLVNRDMGKAMSLAAN